MLIYRFLITLQYYSLFFLLIFKLRIGWLGFKSRSDPSRLFFSVPNAWRCEVDFTPIKLRGDRAWNWHFASFRSVVLEYEERYLHILHALFTVNVFRTGTFNFYWYSSAKTATFSTFEYLKLKQEHNVNIKKQQKLIFFQGWSYKVILHFILYKQQNYHGNRNLGLVRKHETKFTKTWQCYRCYSREVISFVIYEQFKALFWQRCFSYSYSI